MGDNCYAEARDKRFHGGEHWGAGAPRKLSSQSNRNKPLMWNQYPFYQCSNCGWRGHQKKANQLDGQTRIVYSCPNCPELYSLEAARARVFCSSLCDVFDNEVPIEWLTDLLQLIWQTPNLDYLLLTKRIGNWESRIGKTHSLAYSEEGEYPSDFFDWLDNWLTGNPPKNVWLGATIVNQEEADRDIMKLLDTPAAIRFLSMEPLLGPVNLYRHDGQHDYYDYLTGQYQDVDADAVSAVLVDGTGNKIDWVIVGGESGLNARPMHPDWVRSLRDQCKQSGTHFLFKQFGEHDADGNKVGKHKAGRTLDGKTHTEFPV